MRLNFIVCSILVNAVVLLRLLQASGIFISLKYQNVTENQTASAYCNTSGLPYAIVSWFKENQSDVVVSRNNTLTLTSISRADGGRYICNASDGSTFFNDSTFFNVMYAPEMLSITSEQIVLENSSVTLQCNATGNPIPEISFVKEGETVSPTRHTQVIIHIPRILRTDSGIYRCTATNGIGSVIGNTSIDVHYPPKIFQMPKIRDSWLNDKVELVCNGSGNPIPDFTWRRSSGTIVSVSSLMKFTVTNERHFEVYICTARNSLGSASYEVQLHRTRFPPDPPFITNNVTLIKSRNFTLKWTKPAERNSNITRYWVWITRLFHNGSTEDLKSFEHDVALPLNRSFYLDWGRNYQFAVSAENGQGTSSIGVRKNITVIAEPTDITPAGRQDLAVVYGAVGGGVALVALIVICGCYKYRNKQPPPPCPKPDFKEDKHHISISMKELTSQISRKGTNSKDTRLFSKHECTEDGDVPYVTKVSYVNTTTAQEQAHAAIYDNVSHADKSEQEWEIPRENVIIEKIIGKGAFCQVAKAFVEGIGTVAVKMVRDKAGKESSRKDLLAEYKLLQYLGTHENIVLVMGGVTLTDPVMVIFEYVPYGDLLGHLRRSRGLNDTYYNDPDERYSSSLTSRQLMRFSREIADGMAFLSMNKIVHRDLAARNVLVCQGETCKITDFGMARDVTNDEIYQKRTRGRLPVKWTAYEALLYGFYTTQSDVWSYGIVLYEIFTIGGSPYPGQDGRRLAQVIQTGYRMPKPKHVDDEIYALMSECWRTEPERRPKFDTIAMTLRRLERHHKDYIFMNQYEENLYGNLDDL